MFLKKEDGFSLVELSIVMLIAGFFIVPFYNFVMQLNKVTYTEDRMDLIQAGLAEYVRIYGFLPCPARMGAVPTDADYATESRNPAANGACTGLISTPGFWGGSNVLMGAVPIATLQRVMDCRDPYAFDPNTGVATRQRNLGLPIAPDFIFEAFRKSLWRSREIITAENAGGATPDIRTVQNTDDSTPCPVIDHIADEYGNKFLYAVTESATTLTPVNPDPLNIANVANVEQIRVINQNNNLATVDDHMYIILSFGQDGKGAISAEGIARQPACGNAGAALENENCNYAFNAVFRDMPISTVEVDGGYQFDDKMDYTMAGFMREDDVWYWGAGPGIDPSTLRDSFMNPRTKLIIERPTGLVDPDDLVEVNNGDLRISIAGTTGGNLNTTGNVSAENNIGGRDISAEVSMSGKAYCYPGSTAPGC